MYVANIRVDSTKGPNASGGNMNVERLLGWEELGARTERIEPAILIALLARGRWIKGTKGTEIMAHSFSVLCASQSVLAPAANFHHALKGIMWLDTVTQLLPILNLADQGHMKHFSQCSRMGSHRLTKPNNAGEQSR